MMKIPTTLIICCLLAGFPAQAKLRGESNRPRQERESRRLMGDMSKKDSDDDDDDKKDGGVGGQGGTGGTGGGTSQFTPSPVNVPPAWNNPTTPTGQGQRPVTPTTSNGDLGGQSGTPGPPSGPPPTPPTISKDGKKGMMGSSGGGGGGVSGSSGATGGGTWLYTPSPVACPPSWNCPPVPNPPSPAPVDSQTPAPVLPTLPPTTTAPQVPTPTASQGERPTFGPAGVVGGEGLVQPPTDPPVEAAGEPSRVCPSEYAIAWHPFLVEDSVTKKCETTADCVDFEPLGGGTPCCMHPLCVCGGDNAQKELVKCTDDFFA